MKITKRQLKQIIKEEKSKLILEMRSDGTISDDEEDERAALIEYVENEISKLVRYTMQEAERIGGGFRGPGIKAEALKAIANAVARAR
tara:strand:- start:111 stop:374 length:264 start_codon:yes stop_codon:yes gene_type:complete